MSNDLPPDLLIRLAKLLELAGSDQPGERATAAEKAHQLLRAHGLTITQLLLSPRLGAPIAEVRRKPMFRNIDVPVLAFDLLDHGPVLAEWEVRFLRSMALRQSFTEGQVRKVHQIRDLVMEREARAERQRCSA